MPPRARPSDMRAVVIVVTATLVRVGAGLLVVARYAPPPRVAAVHVGPCEVQAIDASTPPCATDPRLAALGALFTHAPFRGFGCIKPAPSPSSRTVEVLGRRGLSTRLRVHTSGANSTGAVGGGATLVRRDTPPRR